MRDSIRGRLLIWYTAMLAVVITAFGLIVSYLAWRSRVAGVDLVLRSRAELLAHALHPAGAGTFDLTLPPGGSRETGDAPYHVIWTAAGELIDRSDAALTVPMPPAAGTRNREGRREVTVRAASGATVLVGRSLAGVYADVWALLGTMAAVGVTAVGVSLAGGWWLVGRALTPIGRISRTARAMVGGDLAARIPVDRVESEFEQLAGALNEAFDRLLASVDRQRRFTADASHELRTPLATVSTEVQWALSRPREPEEYRRSFEACRRATVRMQNAVERLLMLAREEAAADETRRAPVDLEDLVRSVLRDLAPLAAARRLHVSVEAVPVTVTGDPDRLCDAITHVVTNAIQYNVEGGDVRVALRDGVTRAELVVADTGVGVSADDLPRVFEPFFRADPARSREAGGAGLGLAVTRAIILRHGGEVVCESVIGQGTSVTMRLRKDLLSHP